MGRLDGMLVDQLDTESMTAVLENAPNLVRHDQACQQDLTVEAYDRRNQTMWYMPDEYKNLDIAEHVLSLCDTEVELQRVGEELLLYQERDLFDLLRYLKYLVDTMTRHHCIWGVGRGSSVASYVLYKLGVHRIDSLFYQLDAREFLR